MLRLANIKVSVRIAIVALIPVLAFTGFVARDLMEKWTAVQMAEATSTVIETAPLISNLIHELQRERGASATFVTSKGQALADTMRKQRPATDKAIAEWQQQIDKTNRAILGTRFVRALEEAKSALAALAKTRSSIDAFAISGQQTVEYFTSAITNLVTTIEALGDRTEDVRILRQSQAFAAFLKRKEFTGQERATGALGFSAGEFSAAVHRNFLRLPTLQEAQAAIFERNATPAQIELVNRMVKGPIVDELMRMRAIGANAPFDGAAVRTLSGAQWFDAATKYIDLLKTVEERLAADFLAFTRAVTDEVRWSFWSVVLIFLGLLAATGCFAAIVALSLTRPIARLVVAMKELANGNIEIVLPDAARADEIGQMGKAVQVFKDNAQRMRQMEAEQKESERLAAARRKADMRKLADEFEAAVGEIVDGVSSASTELEASATSLSKTAETTKQLSTAVAAASEEASANVQSVASASEEMGASVNEIGRQVQESSRIASEAVVQAEKTDERIVKLSQAASRIGDVTRLITSIAEQTNLLALNATIEAARAGAAGKGFAVVAQEVKALAAQTAKATSEISTQIAEMQEATQDSVAAIKEIGGTIGRISEIATTIASAVEEQGAATLEITRNVQQAAAGTTEVAANITDVNRGATETGAASAQALSSARSLANESNRLKLEMSRFLDTVRAA